MNKSAVTKDEIANHGVSGSFSTIMVARIVILVLGVKQVSNGNLQ